MVRQQYNKTGRQDTWRVCYLASIRALPLVFVPLIFTSNIFIHTLEEHHIGNYDPGAFFTLHDYDNNGYWAPEEILRTYGLEDESTKDVSAEKRKDVVREVLRLVDYDHDGLINRPEWMMFNANGGRLPDFGVRLFGEMVGI